MTLASHLPVSLLITEERIGSLKLFFGAETDLKILNGIWYLFRIIIQMVIYVY